MSDLNLHNRSASGVRRLLTLARSTPICQQDIVSVHAFSGEHTAMKGVAQQTSTLEACVPGDFPRRIGLALSGGGVRGLAHIGVIKALADLGIEPSVIAGTSAGSLIGAGLAAGMNWRDLASMARSVFWPSLLNGKRLEEFCARHLPATFADLHLPFAAVATQMPSKRVVPITKGRLASAISASCAMRILRRPVTLDGRRLKDGGFACVLPSIIARELGAEFVIGSDVWELSSLLRGIGCHSMHPLFPAHYRVAMDHTDLLIQPEIPITAHLPCKSAIERLIAAGEEAAHRLVFLKP